MTLRFSVLCSLPAEVDSSWNKLAENLDDLYLSSRWLEYQRAALRLPARYCVAEDNNGLAAALAVYELPEEMPRKFYDPYFVFAGSPYCPSPGSKCYLLGSPAGYSNDIPFRPGLPEAMRCEVLRELASRLCKEWDIAGRAGSLYLLYASGQCKAALEAADLAEGVIPVLPNYHLRIPGGSFDDYLSNLNHKHRQNVRSEMARFSSAGYTFHAHPLAEMVTAAAPLVTEVERAHGNRVRVARTRDSLAQLASAFGTSAICFHIERGKNITGVVIAVEWGRSLYAGALGLDYPRLIKVGEYFNLAFYGLIEHAYGAGIRRIVLSPTSGEAKIHRGAAEIPGYGIRVRVQERS